MKIDLLFDEHEHSEAMVAMQSSALLGALQDIDMAARNSLKHGTDPAAALQHIRVVVAEALRFLD